MRNINNFFSYFPQQILEKKTYSRVCLSGFHIIHTLAHKHIFIWLFYAVKVDLIARSKLVERDCLRVCTVDRLARLARIEKVWPRFADENFHKFTEHTKRHSSHRVVAIPSPSFSYPRIAAIQHILVTVDGTANRSPHLKITIYNLHGLQRYHFFFWKLRIPDNSISRGLLSILIQLKQKEKKRMGERTYTYHY